jgi:glycosyltransferase involved in cell wall biosynthesis
VPCGVVIPAHNEAGTIARVVRAALEHAPPETVVIVVDDGSRDTTGELAREAGAEVVRNEPNRGYDGALERGFERAAELGCENIVTMDADGQHPAPLLPRFFAALGEHELVVGVRPEPARLAERVFGWYARWRFGVADILCGMKGYRMALYREKGSFDTTRSVGTELSLWAMQRGRSFTTLPVPIAAREDAPRFGGSLQANWLLLKALIRALGASKKN